MKALVEKDLFVLTRQMRIFLLMIVVFAVMPGTSMTTFAVVYAAMLPYTALAYDERSKWDQLAAMLPYTDRDVVLEKYVLGWLLMAATAALSLIAGLITRTDPLGVLLGLCFGLLVMALTLPLMFRLGVERGRMFFILMMVVLGAGGASLASNLVGTSGIGAWKDRLLVILPLAAVAVNAVSVPLSVKLYARRSR